ncbi:MAG: lamin tail domain-containing protein, partial [Planctomycetes bacterium]|nr:lamin tail domain-containing protein [Planctomycetota bacterium]
MATRIPGLLRSALVASTVLASRAAGLTITEIHYNPPAGPAGEEFVELHNERPVSEDLSGWSFTEGIRWTFPEGTRLAGGACLVVAREPDALRAAGVPDVAGPFEGRLDDDGERVTLADALGSTILSVRYGDRWPWPDVADGTGHSLVLRDPWLDPSDPASWRASREIGGTPGRADPDGEDPRETLLVAAGDVWRYRKGLDEPPEDWRSPGFDDGGWLEGPTGIGFGDDDDATILDDMADAYLSVHARRTFEIADPSAFDAFVLRIDYDDGFVAYLNGVEAARGAMGVPGSAAPFDRRATSHEAGRPEEFPIESALVRAGTNVLAIQIHNASLGSLDLSLIPELIARAGGDPEAPPLALNEVHGPEAPPGEAFVEIRNLTDRVIDLSGYLLSDSPSLLDRYRFPAGILVAPLGCLLLGEADLPLVLRDEGLVLFLARPDGLRVIDGAHLGPFPPGCARARDPGRGDRWFATPSPTPGEANRIPFVEGLVINEIAYHPMYESEAAGGDEELSEYIEIFNRNDRAIDLSGFRFTDGIEYAFPPGTTIGAAAFEVIARDPQRLRDEYGIDDVLGPYSGRLDDDGERIELTDAIGNPADEVQYRDADPWPVWADGLGSSLELRDPRADNASPLAWAASDESQRSTWGSYAFEGIFPGGDPEFHLCLLGPGECLVDDIRIERAATQHLPNGSFEDGEAGWHFGGTHRESRVTAEDAAAGTRSLRLIATRRGDSLTNHVECETSPPIQTGQTYRISLRARWLRGFDLLLARTYNHGIARTHRLEVPARRGSPGGPNTVLADNIGPTVRDLVQDPPAPNGHFPIRIRARIEDPDGVAAAEIVWRRDRSVDAGRVPFADDGMGADDLAGDRVFAGEIPGQPSRAIVAYWIEARDGRGEVSTWPREGEDRPLLLQVDLPETPGAIPSYHLIATEDVRQQILSGDPWSNALLNAAFVLDRRRIFHNVGVRQRGCACSRGKVFPPLLRLRFREDQRFLGRPSINLDNQHADPPIQRDRAVSRILQVMGLPYSRHRYVRFHINGTFQKIYEDI